MNVQKFDIVTLIIPDQAIFENLDTVQKTGEQEISEVFLLFFSQPA